MKDYEFQVEVKKDETKEANNGGGKVLKQRREWPNGQTHSNEDEQKPNCILYENLYTHGAIGYWIYIHCIGMIPSDKFPRPSKNTKSQEQKSLVS